MIVKCVLAFPTVSAGEMYRRYREREVAWPEGVTAHGPMVFRFLTEGLRALTVLHIDEAHAAAGLAAVRAYPARYIGVPGFSYIVDVGLDASEFMDHVGLEAMDLPDRAGPWGEGRVVVKVALSFPTESARQMGQRLARGGFDWPEYMTVHGPYYFVFMHEGFRSFTLFSFDEARLPEAMRLLRAYPARYVGVPGFTYVVDQAALDAEVGAFLAAGSGS